MARRYLCAALIAALAGAGEVAWAYGKNNRIGWWNPRRHRDAGGQDAAPKGCDLIALPDQIYCGRISDGQGWQLLQPFNADQAGQFRDVVVDVAD